MPQRRTFLQALGAFFAWIAGWFRPKKALPAPLLGKPAPLPYREIVSPPVPVKPGSSVMIVARMKNPAINHRTIPPAIDDPIVESNLAELERKGLTPSLSAEDQEIIRERLEVPRTTRS